MTFLRSRKRPPSIVLPCGRLRELILLSEQFKLIPLFRISEEVAYENFDCNRLSVTVASGTGTKKDQRWLWSFLTSMRFNFNPGACKHHFPTVYPIHTFTSTGRSENNYNFH